MIRSFRSKNASIVRAIMCRLRCRGRSSAGELAFSRRCGGREVGILCEWLLTSASFFGPDLRSAQSKCSHLQVVHALKCASCPMWGQTACFLCRRETRVREISCLPYLHVACMPPHWTRGTSYCDSQPALAGPKSSRLTTRRTARRSQEEAPVIVERRCTACSYAETASTLGV